MNAPSKLSILGLDPSLACTGWALLRINADNTVYANWGLIKTNNKEDLDTRLSKIFNSIGFVANQDIDHVALETPFLGKNIQTALKLGMAQSALILGIRQVKPLIPINRYTPATIKKTCTGLGNADKKVVRASLAKQLSLNELPKSLDASDALATAYCCYVNLRF